MIDKTTKLSEHLTSSSEAALSHSSDLDGIGLSPHFTLGELIKTNTRMENVPNEEQVDNLRRMCRWLERLRKKWNDLYGEGDDPLIVNSAFRTAKVNKAVGGVADSNHLTGCAADIRCVGVEQALRYATLLLNISDMSREAFDELLIERSGRGGYWVHFAVRHHDNRRNISVLKGG